MHDCRSLRVRGVVAIEVHGRRHVLRRLLEGRLGLGVGELGCDVAEATHANTTRDERLRELRSDLGRANLGIIRPVRQHDIAQRLKTEPCSDLVDDLLLVAATHTG